MDIKYQKAKASDLKAMKNLILEHGPNEWNYLTEEGVDAELLLVSEGKATAILAIHQEKIVGFAVSIDGNSSPDHLTKYCNLSEIIYVGNVVVHKKYTGKGIGSKLLTLSLNLAKDCNVKYVFIKRHEENVASAGMMKNAGFKLVDTFYDPEKRSSGSRMTSILKYDIYNDK